VQHGTAINLIVRLLPVSLVVKEVLMKPLSVVCKLLWLANFVVFAFAFSSTEGANAPIITFQEGAETSSENRSPLIGHWRKTTIVFESPKDEHLVLHADGTAENWAVTAESRTEPITGHWSVEGKTLTLSFGDHENSQPFTFYQGQLVFPNIPNRRGFWEKIE
jgi:hypothetical protein